MTQKVHVYCFVTSAIFQVFLVPFTLEIRPFEGNVNVGLDRIGISHQKTNKDMHQKKLQGLNFSEKIMILRFTIMTSKTALLFLQLHIEMSSLQSQWSSPTSSINIGGLKLNLANSQ